MSVFSEPEPLPKIAEALWRLGPQRAGQVDIKLTDGKIFTRLWVNNDGVVVGRIMPAAADMVPEVPKEITSDKIGAFRPSGGWLERFGIKQHWLRIRQI